MGVVADDVHPWATTYLHLLDLGGLGGGLAGAGHGGQLGDGGRLALVVALGSTVGGGGCACMGSKECRAMGWMAARACSHGNKTRSFAPTSALIKRRLHLPEVAFDGHGFWREGGERGKFCGLWVWVWVEGIGPGARGQ